MKTALPMLAAAAALGVLSMSGCNANHSTATAATAGSTAAAQTAVAQASSAQPAVVSTAGDPYHWLEAVHGERATAWVDKENAKTKATAFASGPEFEKLRKQLLEVMNSQARIPFVGKMG